MTVLGVESLVYELHLSSFAPVDLTITRIEVLDASRPGGLVATFEGPEVAELLGGPGVRRVGAETPAIAPGTRAVAYFWLTLDPSRAARGALAHRIFFREASVATASSEVEGGHAGVLESSPPVLGSPLRGGPWVAVYDPADERGHRRVLLALVLAVVAFPAGPGPPR